MCESATVQDPLPTQNKYGRVCRLRSTRHPYAAQALLAGPGLEPPTIKYLLKGHGGGFRAYRRRAKPGATESGLIPREIDGRTLDCKRFMASIDNRPVEQLIYCAGEMIFVNTVYAPLPTCLETSPST